MGIISIKLSQNYDYLPIDAAEAYINSNYTKTFQLPKVDNWELVPNLDYSKGFGVIGKLVNEYSSEQDQYIGFSVCFLLNQTSGVQDIVTKSVKIQSAAGDITAAMEKLAVDTALAVLSDEAKTTGQVYIDAAKAALSKMNEINQSGSDWDFNYQFNLSTTPIWGDSGSSKYPLGFEDATFENLKTKGTKVPIGTGNTSIYDYTIDGKQYSLPGFFGSGIVWNQGSGTSFYQVNQTNKNDNRNQVENEVADGITECHDKQVNLLEELRQKIDGKQAG